MTRKPTTADAITIQTRVRADVVADLDRVREWMATQPIARVHYGKVTRSDAMRLALTVGLRHLRPLMDSGDSLGVIWDGNGLAGTNGPGEKGI